MFSMLLLYLCTYVFFWSVVHLTFTYLIKIHVEVKDSFNLTFDYKSVCTLQLQVRQVPFLVGIQLSSLWYIFPLCLQSVFPKGRRILRLGPKVGLVWSRGKFQQEFGMLNYKIWYICTIK